IFRVQLDCFLYILNRGSILLLLSIGVAADRIRDRFFAVELNHAIQIGNDTIDVAPSKFSPGAGVIKASVLRSELDRAGEISDRAVKVAFRFLSVTTIVVRVSVFGIEFDS